ncbi:MAG: Serine/threonine-protein kinase PknD [Phycisphaerae bacterium]|nr:Serine/threonine-protein kinase PknD [Phycisphaerae bacterium]
MDSNSTRHDEDSVFARTVIDAKLATADEVATCVAEVRRINREGSAVIRLAELLVEQGYITESQRRRLSEDSRGDTTYRPAQQIPGFQIQGKIGQGAMATVYKAKQISLDRIVAIKVLPKRMGENSEFVNRFYREGRAAAKLNHVNIVQAIDVGEAGGYHYFVMEFIDGKTVWDDLRERGNYNEKEALDIVTQSAQALQHAHERGLIHRDIKPKNIMITKTGVVKLADLGLAREMSDMEAAMAEAGRAYGTPYYISPEQIRGEVNIDLRADIYSLGATFYHMVTGRVPFEGNTPSAVMHKHLKEPLVPPDHLNTTLSAGVGEVIEVMMAKKREDRYISTKDLIMDLDAIVRGEPPLIARSKYDQNVLHELAVGGETISMPAIEVVETREKEYNLWPVVGILCFLLILSIVINIVMILGD